MKNVYLDNNATTKVAPEVIEAMQPFFEELWGNPSSLHSFGGQVQKHVEDARESVAALIGAEPSEIVFTSCGTESDNMAIRGAALASDRTPIVITSRVEHPAVLNTCKHLESRGAPLVELAVDSSGQIDLGELRKAVSGGPAVVSLMWANNETGVSFPIHEIAEIVKSAGGVFHTDAVQAVGKVPIDMKKTPVDMLALSGHKLHAPKGIGVLYIRKGTKVEPLMIGGHHEAGRRAGTLNVPYIVGIGAACRLAMENLDDEMTRVAALRDRMAKGVLETCPDTQVNGDIKNRLPNTSNISFQYIEGEAILLKLNDIGISASSGSACASGSLEPSHVIRAMGVPFTAAHGSTRFSLSRYSTDDEVDHLLEHMPGIVDDLRKLSPFIS